MIAKLLLLACLLGYGSASIVGGRRTYINYNSRCGVWNDRTLRRGKILEECCPIDATYPGSPWQQLSVSYRQGSTVQQFLGNSAFFPNDCPNYQVVSERVLDDGTGRVGIEHVFRMGLLQVTKTEEWDFDGKIVLISFKVKYTKDAFLGNCRPIYNLTVMHAVDPDQDREPFSTFQTINDVIYNGGSGLFAEAVGPRSCKTMGYGICSTRPGQGGGTDEVGFTSWARTTPANLRDPNGQLRDDTMHYQHTETRPMYCGDEREFRFFAVWGRCHDEARNNFFAAHRRFCNRCFPLGLLARPPTPRCLGRCPCTARNANCSCAYTCRAGPTYTPTDIISARAEYSRILSLCSGRHKRALEASGSKAVPAAEVNPNIEVLKLTEKECESVNTENNRLVEAALAG